MCYFDKLIKTFKENSNDKDKDYCFEEWEFLKVVESVNKCGVCCCGKTNLKYINYFRNRINGNILYVGSICNRKAQILTHGDIECFNIALKIIKEKEYIKKIKKSLKNGDCLTFKTNGVPKMKIKNYLYTIKMKCTIINLKKMEGVKKIIKNPPIWKHGDLIYCNVVYNGDIENYLLENKNKINCIFKLNKKGYTNIIIK